MTGRDLGRSPKRYPSRALLGNIKALELSAGRRVGFETAAMQWQGHLPSIRMAQKGKAVRWLPPVRWPAAAPQLNGLSLGSGPAQKEPRAHSHRSICSRDNDRLAARTPSGSGTRASCSLTKSGGRRRGNRGRSGGALRPRLRAHHGRDRQRPGPGHPAGIEGHHHPGPAGPHRGHSVRHRSLSSSASASGIASAR